MFTNTLALIRIKDWLKNIVIFLPLIFSGNLSAFNLYIIVFFTFLNFSTAASCIYIINDIKDLDDDKKHKIKKNIKPLAANFLSLNYAYIILILISTLTLILIISNRSVMNHVLLYVFVNILYSYYLKNIPFLEVFLICFGYLIRLDAGSLIIGVNTSFFLSSSVFFICFFVISIKRLVEISNEQTSRNRLFFYKPITFKIMSLISGLMFLVFTLIFFISSKSLLIFVYPVLIFLLYRYYKIANLLNIGEFPFDVIFKDKFLIFLGSIIIFYTIYLYL